MHVIPDVFVVFPTSDTALPALKWPCPVVTPAVSLSGAAGPHRLGDLRALPVGQRGRHVRPLRRAAGFAHAAGAPSSDGARVIGSSRRLCSKYAPFNTSYQAGQRLMHRSFPNETNVSLDTSEMTAAKTRAA